MLEIIVSAHENPQGLNVKKTFDKQKDDILCFRVPKRTEYRLLFQIKLS